MFERTDGGISYEIVDGFDHVIDESGNTTLNLRKIRWNGSDKTKLDIRFWYASDKYGNGEAVGKGASFLTENGPHEMVKVLINEGYGKTKEILEGIKDREDFGYYLNQIVGKDSEFYDENAKDIKEDYYDPSQLLD